MRLVAVSDTHGLHRQVKLPEGDVLIHCGDWTYRGEKDVYLDGFNWLKENANKYKHIFVIVGNHDFNSEYFADLFKSAECPNNIHYLENSGIEVEGIKFFGVPYVPNLPLWAYPEFPRCYDKIPEDTQVLISHSPIEGVLDNEMWHYGSTELKKVVHRLIENNLTHFICGHIHESYGVKEIYNSKGDSVIIANACICDRQYVPNNKPIAIEI